MSSLIYKRPLILFCYNCLQARNLYLLYSHYLLTNFLVLTANIVNSNIVLINNIGC